VKLRDLLRKLNDMFRPMHMRGEGHSLQVGEGLRVAEDNVDALASGISPGHVGAAAGDFAPYPPRYVPSQQDERPRH
jgi:hypothetical protein